MDKRSDEVDQGTLILRRQINRVTDRLGLPHFICMFCGRVVERQLTTLLCPKCKAPFVFDMEEKISKFDKAKLRHGGTWRYIQLLALPDEFAEDPVSLGEGDTPLLKAHRLGGELDLSKVLIKNEAINPTGSYLDRSSTLLVTAVVRSGYSDMIAIGGGNLVASLSAYATRAGLPFMALTPSRDPEKIAQTTLYGARASVEASWYTANWRAVTGVKDEDDYLVIPVDPIMTEGKKTTVFEIVEQLGWEPPDFVALPAADGAHALMTIKGLMDLDMAGLIKSKRSTKLIVAHAGETDREEIHELGTAFMEYFNGIRSNIESIDAARFIEVSIGEATRIALELARTEGILVEPAAAISVAGVERMREMGEIDRGDRVVVVVTGSGLKRVLSMVRKIPYSMIIEEKAIGATKRAILEELSKRAVHGYELWRLLKGRGIQVTLAAVYEHLADLERDGLTIRVNETFTGGRRRVYYALSDKGYSRLYSS